MNNSNQIFWNFHSEELKNAGAIPPEKIRLSYSKYSDDSTILLKDFADKKRAIEKGYIVKPNDCPAIISINNYGFLFKCPREVKITYDGIYYKEKIFTEQLTRHGHFIIEGDHWPKSDSNKVVSWISGSKFFKIQTGIDIYFPIEYSIYQGGIPYGIEFDNQGFNVWQGIEVFTKKRLIDINNKKYCVCNVNFIGTFKEGHESFNICAGDPVGVLYPILPIQTWRLSKYQINEHLE